MTDSMTPAFTKDYRNWYVLTTIPGTEWKTKKAIQSIFHDNFDLYLPCRELVHMNGGRFRKVIMPMFPGYLFLHNKIEIFARKIRHSHINSCGYPLLCDDGFARVNENEMEFLMRMTGAEGIVSVSKGVIDEKKKVKIIKGPLKELTGKILFVNKRKQKAKILIRMMNREVQVSLGFEILKSE